MVLHGISHERPPLRPPTLSPSALSAARSASTHTKDNLISLEHHRNVPIPCPTQSHSSTPQPVASLPPHPLSSLCPPPPQVWPSSPKFPSKATRVEEHVRERSAKLEPSQSDGKNFNWGCSFDTLKIECWIPKKQRRVI
jgi:hypothetical protein